MSEQKMLLITFCFNRGKILENDENDNTNEAHTKKFYFKILAAYTLLFLNCQKKLFTYIQRNSTKKVYICV